VLGRSGGDEIVVAVDDQRREHRLHLKCFSPSLVGHAAELESPAYAYTRFLRYSVWDTLCRI
jgi:hypothetical protein